MEAGNTLNRPSLPTFAVSMPVFDALRRFLCVSGTQVGVPLAPWLYCSDRASSRQLVSQTGNFRFNTRRFFRWFFQYDSPRLFFGQLSA